ncbi:phytanoyl-CoA dioxygenase family protein [Phenylobacterium sp.]|uniref:phytanoyl-CoA dioxygenase family protein n=1 Tax=Phenylobacterium sp. TaxID=1871053 RepID=UPI0028118C9C|nr:phytanoyl-CoA dioxygenase family protein [Phenylobacterium sp.]
MNATAKSSAAWSLSEQVVSDFIRQGAHLFDEVVDPTAAAELLAEIRATRAFDESLFLSEAEFDADPQYTGVNPRPGRNLLERFEDRLGFVERAPHIVEAVTALLGEGYEILNKKVVCGVPAKSVPEWLRARIHGNPVNNLGAYVKPQNRDVTYFYGIDFHQDLIDYKEREADFLTLYVYLHPVTKADAPLYLLEGSHRLGGSVFPHDLTRTGDDSWLYRNGPHGEASVRQRILTGGTGFAAIWHACTLHGTQPDAADHERISLRYLIARGAAQRSGMDAVNATLTGPLSLTDTRKDLDAQGAAVIRQNTVLKA